MLSLGLAVAFGAMISFAISDFLAKKPSSKIGSKRTTLIMLGSSLLTLIIGAYFVGLSNINTTVVLFSLAAGLTYVVAFLLMYKSLETQQVANTISLAGIEYALITILGVVVLGESVTTIELISFVVVFVGAFLATTSKKFEFNKGYAPAVLAMVVFAITYLFLVFARQSSGGTFAPLIIRQAIAVGIMLAYLRVSPEKGKHFKDIKLKKIGYPLLAINVLVGIFNGIGSLCLLLLARFAFVAVGSAIVATESAVIVFLGYLIYKERFERHQMIGFIMLVLGTIALSIA